MISKATQEKVFQLYRSLQQELGIPVETQAWERVQLDLPLCEPSTESLRSTAPHPQEAEAEPSRSQVAVGWEALQHAIHEVSSTSNRIALQTNLLLLLLEVLHRKGVQFPPLPVQALSEAMVMQKRRLSLTNELRTAAKTLESALDVLVRGHQMSLHHALNLLQDRALERDDERF